MGCSLAVIIPALNEGRCLGALLDDIARQTLQVQTVVVDGGSSDDTLAVASQRGAKILSAPQGRAVQMNAGRAAVEAPWLLFLHADSRIEDDTLLQRALDSLDATQCGHFRLRFRTDDWRFRYLEAKTALNRPHTINGDQGLLTPAAIFDAVGGFDTTLGFMEDQRFVAAARDAGFDWVTLPGELTTSARRFRRQGFGPQYFNMAVLMAACAGGADELFELDPNIYERDLADLIKTVRSATRKMRPTRALEVYMQAARFVRAETWQVFFLLDVFFGDAGSSRCLHWYDRVLRDVDLPLLDGLIAAFGYVLLNLVLSPD